MGDPLSLRAESRREPVCLCGTACGTMYDMDTYSGKFNIRIPPALHAALAERAKDEGVSLNQMVTSLLAGGLGFAFAGSPVRLTKAEAEALHYGARSIADDIDETGLDGPGKRAYARGMTKLRSAMA